MRFPFMPKYIQHLFPCVLWSKPVASKAIYLTFDDGPNIDTTYWILDILKQYKAKATFFCIGKNVMQYPTIYNTIIEQGHSVGNHTYTHLNAWRTSVEHYIADVDKACQYIDSILFRPPYGKLTPRIYKQLKKDYQIVLWDVMPYDFDKSVDAYTCLKYIKAYTKNGSIIVLHDNIKSVSNIQFILPQLLTYFTERGYQFLPL